MKVKLKMTFGKKLRELKKFKDKNKLKNINLLRIKRGFRI